MFKDSKSLKEHKKSVHENKKPCKCDICNNIFSFQTSLKRHVKTIHEEKRPEKKPSKVYVDSENKPNYSNAPLKQISPHCIETQFKGDRSFFDIIHQNIDGA